MSNQMVQINPEQAKSLKELGYHLQQLRQKQRISLETVAKKTLIPVRLLTAIETGNSEQLPEPVYIQGFLRRYGDAIGIDGTALASAFPAQTNLRTPKPSWRTTVQAQLRPLHLYCLYTVLVVGSVSGLSYQLNRSSTLPVLPPSPGSTPAVPDVPAKGQPNALPASGNKLPQSVVPAPQKSVHVGLTMTSQSWVRIVVDGKTEFEGVLSEGAKRDWEANKQLILRAGNAGGVMVSFNNGAAKPLGEPGSVEEVTFEPNQTASRPSSSESETLTASSANSF